MKESGEMEIHTQVIQAMLQLQMESFAATMALAETLTGLAARQSPGDGDNPRSLYDEALKRHYASARERMLELMDRLEKELENS